MKNKIFGTFGITLAIAAGVLFTSEAIAAPSSSNLAMRYSRKGVLTLKGKLNKTAGRKGCRTRIVGGVANVGDTEFDKRATLGFRSIRYRKRSFKIRVQD